MRGDNPFGFRKIITGALNKLTTIAARLESFIPYKSRLPDEIKRF